MIDLHHAEAQVRFGPHLPRRHFTVSTVQSEKTATLRANQAGTWIRSQQNAPSVPYASKSGYNHLIVLRNGFGLVRKQCNNYRGAGLCLSDTKSISQNSQLKEVMSKRPSHIFTTTGNIRIFPDRDVGAHGCHILFCTHTVR